MKRARKICRIVGVPIMLIVCVCFLAWRIHDRVVIQKYRIEALIQQIRPIKPPEKQFFSKQLAFESIPIKAHSDVADEALVAAHERLFEMFSGFGAYRSTIISNLASAGVELHIIGRHQVTTDLPEYRDQKGKHLAFYNGLTMDQRTRGLGGTLVSCGEENLLKLFIDRYRGRDICIHEFAHTIRNTGMTPKLRAQFDEQYRRSLKKGLWQKSYAATNPDEFFAELSMWYFGTHGDLGMTGIKPKNGKAGLSGYDAEAYALLVEFYSGNAKL